MQEWRCVARGRQEHTIAERALDLEINYGECENIWLKLRDYGEKGKTLRRIILFSPKHLRVDVSYRAANEIIISL
jgi:hypothetical protein